jgi:two-component system cell cycle response regulator DivK
MDGITALARLRDEAATKAIPVVALTALAMQSDRDRIMQAGFDGYLSKPIDVKTFADQVRPYCSSVDDGKQEEGR